MGKIKLIFGLFIAFLILSSTAFSQTKTVTNGKYTYETVEGDPLKARIYTLDNGLKVYLSVYQDAPRIQTYIAIRAGSKNDPADATGLAHYLEHMLFKGTDKYGSLDYEKEKVYLDQIIELYNVYGKTTDESQRKAIYHQIDSISSLASKYAIANEYDKMLSSLGASGTNAFTSNEQTVYVNDIPSNQIEKWLTIEAERFRNPQMRLFHTELEVVYEEKNRSLDNDFSKAFETLYLALFPTHQYGTQTTIGTIEHLKNPALQKTIDYFKTYYVPNNMAICLSGDFDPDRVIEMIDNTFGKMPRGNVPEYIPPVEKPITSVKTFEVTGPNPEGVLIGYRFPGENTRDADLLTVTDMILSNSKAGLIDLNLNQKQRVLEASSNPRIITDYSIFTLYGRPREGQSLEEVKNLLLAQLDSVKQGRFPDWLIEAVNNNMKLDQIRNNESNRFRAGAFMTAFIERIPWQDYVTHLERLKGITKEDVMRFANENFKDNYVVVYKKTGEDKNTQKVIKPEITPVEVNREAESDFVKMIVNTPADKLSPVFVDYKQDIKEFKIKSDVPVYYTNNDENALFSMSYVFDMGTNNNKMLAPAIAYLPYLGTSQYTPEQLQQEFYKLGCSFSVNTTYDRVFISLNGLNDNFVPSLQLFESLLNDPVPNEEALINLKKDILKVRADAMLSKQSILSAMSSYGVYGKQSPLTNVLSNTDVENLNAVELVNLIKSLDSYQHKVLYYGPLSENELKADLDQYHEIPAVLNPVPDAKKFSEMENLNDKIYVVNYDMVQAEIMMISQKDTYDRNKVPLQTLFNEYFGGSMSSITFQELRESKALAYSVFATQRFPDAKEKHGFIYAYIGSQADKLPEAMNAMFELLNNMPKSDITFNTAKNSIIQQIESERITKANVLNNYLAAQKLGNDYDIRKDIYEQIPSMTFEDIQKFHAENIKDSKYTIMVLGDRNKLDVNTLSKYGKVEFLTLEDIFGYQKPNVDAVP
ncbi:MAG TPA: insulinase family protein [Ignavibacteria bacterium]|nr:insulinase family protein [Ignavibacteria bacterium]